MTEKDVFNIPGKEWAIFSLATAATIVSLEVDTNHFKGNAPDYITIEGALKRCKSANDCNEGDWTVILDKMRLQPHKQHSYKREIKNVGPFSCIRITIAPDGGISRVRILGHRFIEKPTEEAVNATTAPPQVESETKCEKSNNAECTPANDTTNTQENDTNDTNNSKDETATETTENNQEEKVENGCDWIGLVGIVCKDETRNYSSS